jgi:5-methylcytosine-specific restriction endonuclease McrA
MGEMDEWYGEYPDGGRNPCDGDPDDEPSCVNCDRPIEHPRFPYLYCSQLCRQEAKYVRYSRSVLKDGRIEQPDVQEALSIRLASILGGGYPERERHLTPEAREAAFLRDGSRCRICGAAATEIDHIGPPIGGDINHPDNLQLCGPCHRQKTVESFQIVTRESDPEKWAWCEEQKDRLMARVLAPQPMRPCDDETNRETEWHFVAQERKELYDW